MKPVKLGKNRCRKYIRLAGGLAAVCLILFTNSVSFAQSFTQDDLDSIIGGTPFFDPTCASGDTSSTSSTNTTTSSGGPYDQILQAIAIQESGGNPTAGSAGGASGKYQFEPSSWQSAGQSYPPAAQYPYAGAAPEDVQDAAAYLWALNAYKQYGESPFWVAIYWYESSLLKNYPNENAPALAQIPAGNNLTLAGFGNLITQEVQSGEYQGTPISSITLSYSSAPDFQQYLTQDGGAPSDSPPASSPTTPTSSSNCCPSGSSTTASSTTIPAQGDGTWTSNAQPPYYLEEFVINVLEDLAQTTGVPQSNTVTQEHVVALVAWAWAEGGNLANTDTFNPYNSNQVVPGAVIQSTGDEAYSSFDSGVQATVLTMTGSNQNRLAQVLTQPGSTAEEFMQTLTYYQYYAGELAWATADTANQQQYLNTLMSSLQQTRSNYAQEASVEIGPGQEDTANVPASQLQYSGGTSNPTSSGATATSGSCGQSSSTSVSCSGTSATGNAAIACDALQYDPLSYSQAWHSSGSEFHSKCNATYPQDTPPAIGPNCATDCSGLVNIVIYDVFNNDINDNTYGEVSDKANFEEIPFSELQPGDFVQPNPGHVVIVESVQGNTINGFAAQTDGVPQPEQVGTQSVPVSSDNVYLRYIGQGSSYQNGQ